MSEKKEPEEGMWTLWLRQWRYKSLVSDEEEEQDDEDPVADTLTVTSPGA